MTKSKPRIKGIRPVVECPACNGTTTKDQSFVVTTRDGFSFLVEGGYDHDGPVRVTSLRDNQCNIQCYKTSTLIEAFALIESNAPYHQ